MAKTLMDLVRLSRRAQKIENPQQALQMYNSGDIGKIKLAMSYFNQAGQFDYLYKAFKSEDPGIRWLAISLIGNNKQAGIHPVVPYLNDPVIGVRQQAEKVVRRRKNEIQDLVTETLQDHHYNPDEFEIDAFIDHIRGIERR